MNSLQVNRGDYPKIFKKAIFVFLPIFALVFLLVYFWSTNQYTSVINSIRIEEREKTTIASQIVSASLKEVDNDLLFLSLCEFLRTINEDVNENENENENEDNKGNKKGRKKKFVQGTFSNFSLAKQVYDQIRFISADGMEQIRVNLVDGKPQLVSEENLQNKSDRYYFTEVFRLNQGEIYVSPLDLNMEKGEVETPFKPMLRIGTPVFNFKGEKIGIVLLNYLAENMLSEIREIFSSVSAEHSSYLNSDKKRHTDGFPLLLNKRGDFLIAENSKDEWGFMFKKPHKLEDCCPSVWEMISARNSGQKVTKKGLFTFTTIYPAPTTINKKNRLENSLYWKLSSFVKKESLDEIRVTVLKDGFIIAVPLLFILLVLSFFYSKNSYLKKEAQSKVKTLSGFIPICANCKNIRDDSGYWNQVEEYISAHSEADFSHSLCPTCAKDLYPDLDLSELDKK